MDKAATNTRIVLVERPTGLPDVNCWRLVESGVAPPGEGQVLVRIIYVSIDPAMRGWLNDVESYLPPVAIGDTMRALSIAQVIESKTDEYAVGDYVSGMFGVQRYATVTPDPSMYKIETSAARPSTHLGVLGMPGMTAYFGLLEIGEPKPGDTVLVSGAAGAVGAAVGQIAKLKGCRVVGVAGGQDKCRYLIEQLGFDAAIDYKTTSDLAGDLKRACSNGINVLFDNVGGDFLDTAIPLLCKKARIVVCGAIAHYNDEGNVEAKLDYLPLLFNSVRLEGFVILDYVHRYPEAMEQMAKWLADGLITSREDIYQGIENFPEVLPKLFNGQNFGKLVLQISEET